MWLYLPTSCRSAPATEASTSDLESPIQRLEASVSWKGKLLSQPSWKRALRTAVWTRPLFGAICEPSTAARGAASWISSLRATRASRSASPASGSGKRIRVISGRRSPASSASASRSGSFSKTSAGTCAWDFATSPSSYEAWVIASRRDCLRRRKAARRIGANGSSCWPTARAQDAESCGNHPGATDSLTGATRQWKTPHGLANNADGGGGEFHKQVTHWQTPATDSFRSRGGDRKDEPGLDRQARCWSTPRTITGGGETALRKQELGRKESGGGDLQSQASIWPTPCANPAPRGRNFTKSDGHAKPHDLTTAVNVWPTPCANDHKSSVTGVITKANARPLREAVSSFPPVLTISTPGATSSPSTPKLNPLFVESLMGLPLGWTGCERLATGSFPSWLRSHTARLEQLLEIEQAARAA